MAAGGPTDAVSAMGTARPAASVYFPNNETDALLHFSTSTIFLAGAAHYFLIERP